MYVYRHGLRSLELEGEPEHGRVAKALLADSVAFVIPVPVCSGIASIVLGRPNILLSIVDKPLRVSKGCVCSGGYCVWVADRSGRQESDEI